MPDEFIPNTSKRFIIVIMIVMGIRVMSTVRFKVWVRVILSQCGLVIIKLIIIRSLGHNVHFARLSFVWLWM